jgi:hypothetical protein
MEIFILWIGINALVGYAIGQKKNEIGASIRQLLDADYQEYASARVRNG